jgi:transcription-repair coupling factor (superfamily II helicase)
VEAGPTGGRIEFGSDTLVEPLTIVQMVQKEPAVFRLQGASTLKYTLPMETKEQRIEQLQALLTRLTPANNGH